MDTNLARQVERQMKDSDYKKLNLRGNPFLPISLKDKELPDLIGREADIDILIRYIVDMLKDKLESVAILGTKGIGKTHFLLHVHHGLHEYLEKLGLRVTLIRSADEFKEFYDSEPLLDRSKFIFIDDIEQIWYKYPDAMHRTFENNKVKVVATWNKSGWNNLKHGTQLIPKSATINLSKLNYEVCEKIIEGRLTKFVLDRSKPFPFVKESISTIARVSNGVPYTITTLADKCIQLAIQQGKKQVDEDISGLVARETGVALRELQNKLDELTKTQTKVLVGLWEMTSSFKRAVRADELADFLGMQRPAVVQHLLALEKDSGILSKRRGGREVRYYIKPLYLEYIGSFIEDTGQNHRLLGL